MAEAGAKRTPRGRHTVAPMPTIQLSEATSDYIEEQLANARAEIVSRFAQITEAEDAGALTSTGKGSGNAPVSFAADELAQVFREVELGGPREKPTKAAFFSSFSPITLVCVFLCSLFAILALYAYSSRSAAGVANQASGFLDLAKVFAGVIVGSASSTVPALVKRRRTKQNEP